MSIYLQSPKMLNENNDDLSPKEHALGDQAGCIVNIDESKLNSNTSSKICKFSSKNSEKLLTKNDEIFKNTVLSMKMINYKVRQAKIDHTQRMYKIYANPVVSKIKDPCHTRSAFRHRRG